MKLWTAPHWVKMVVVRYGLRETLSNCLFGELEVYQARKDMKKACFFARHDVVSLDDDDGNNIVKKRKLFPCHIHSDQILKENPVLNSSQLKNLTLFSLDSETSQSHLPNLLPSPLIPSFTPHKPLPILSYGHAARMHGHLLHHSIHLKKV